MSVNYALCDECGWEIDDEGLLLPDGRVVHESCAEDMLADGRIAQADFDDAIPYDADDQASYQEEYRDPWSW